MKCSWVSRQLGDLEVPDGCVEGKGSCLNGVRGVVRVKGVGANLTSWVPPTTFASELECVGLSSGFGGSQWSGVVFLASMPHLAPQPAGAGVALRVTAVLLCL